MGALSLVGRRNIANSMVMGRFRYYIQSMEIPTDIVEWIDSDVQQLLWGKGGTGSTLRRRARTMVDAFKHIRRALGRPEL